MSVLQEFKKFAMRGNVIDMAVGVIMGGAFGKIVSSLVNDVVMPPIGMILGNVDFSKLAIPLGEGDKAATLRYGSFLQSVVDFLIVALAIFLLVKTINRATTMMHEEKDQQVPKTKECPRCCSVIPIKAVRCPSCTSELAA